jgi:dCTP deaminase
MLSATGLIARINLATNADPGMLSIVPQPNTESMASGGAASVDLRLGRWFRTLRPSRTPHLQMIEAFSGAENREKVIHTKEHFVRFGEPFILHPPKFCIRNYSGMDAITLRLGRICNW